MKHLAALYLALVLGTALVAQARAGNPTADLENFLARVDNFTEAKAVSIVIAGDTGKKAFSRVGEAIAGHCKKHACHFAVLLGDNFYLWPFKQGPYSAKSRAFATRFYQPLEGLEFNVWPVLGNHGYLLWARPKAQIRHTFLPRSDASSEPDWLLPDHVFEIPKLPPWLEVVGFDSQLVLKKPARRSDHLKHVRDAFGSSSGWRVLVGHHPFHTSGKHGKVDEEQQEQLWGQMGTLIKDENVQLVLSGHDHHVEFIEASGFVQVIQGGGSTLRTETRTDPLARNARCRFFSNQQLGFGKVTMMKEEFKVEYFSVYDDATSMLRSFTCRRGASGLTCSQEPNHADASGCPSTDAK